MLEKSLDHLDSLVGANPGSVGKEFPRAEVAVCQHVWASLTRGHCSHKLSKIIKGGTTSRCPLGQPSCASPSLQLGHTLVSPSWLVYLSSMFEASCLHRAMTSASSGISSRRMRPESEWNQHTMGSGAEAAASFRTRWSCRTHFPVCWWRLPRAAVGEAQREILLWIGGQGVGRF